MGGGPPDHCEGVGLLKGKSKLLFLTIDRAMDIRIRPKRNPAMPDPTLAPIINSDEQNAKFLLILVWP